MADYIDTLTEDFNRAAATLAAEEQQTLAKFVHRINRGTLAGLIMMYGAIIGILLFAPWWAKLIAPLCWGAYKILAMQIANGFILAHVFEKAKVLY